MGQLKTLFSYKSALLTELLILTHVPYSLSTTSNNAMRNESFLLLELIFITSFSHIKHASHFT
ncbi:hypothetical protein VCHA38O206_140152 [Vibrio chagasii]|nr:hypothetical protein VCHA35P150_120151 [Vibrio chagasii]CAH7013067.1 hypothetical protein VCHA38O206_140152 [Vibrio chagasii]